MYEFQLRPEIFWAIITGAALMVLQILVVFEPEAIQDWETWVITSVGAVVRAAAGAGLAYLGTRQ